MILYPIALTLPLDAQEARDHLPSPFCAAKEGRVERSETQGVHTKNTSSRGFQTRPTQLT